MRRTMHTQDNHQNALSNMDDFENDLYLVGYS